MANNKNFVVKNGLTVGTDATIGSTLYVSTVDTTDSSAITVIPSTTFNSDVTVENDLRVTNAIENTSGNTILPAVLGNADQVLTVNADGNNASWKSISDVFGGGIDNVVDDTTPQLGGNLDLNSQNITGTGNIDVTGNVTASGSLFVPIIDTADSSAITVVPAATFNSDVTVENDSFAKIKMTLTTPNCPVAESLPKEVKEGAMQVEGIDNVDLELVWDPPWNKDMMSEAAKLELNL